MKEIGKRIAKLIDVKSFVTVSMTIGLLALLFSDHQPAQELLALYCTSYGSIMTYYYTRKDDGK